MNLLKNIIYKPNINKTHFKAIYRMIKTFLHVGMSVCPNGHGGGLKSACEANGWQYVDINTAHPDLNRVICEYSDQYKPAIVWIQIQSTGIYKETIEKLKANNAYIIQWCGDKRHTLPDFYFHYAQWGVDLSTFSNNEDIEIMRKCGYSADWLQIGFDENIYSPHGEVNKQADIIFMGNHFGHFPLSSLRRDMVKELKRVYGDRFKAFGSGMPDGSYMGNQTGEAAVYRGAKIGINLSHFDCERYTSDRLFRMLGCGVCVLTHNYKEIEKDFMHGHDLVIWNDINDLKRLINELIIDESTRQKIAKKGHELAMEKFTFEAMGNEILNLYNKYNP